jgi:hypothetical protein
MVPATDLLLQWLDVGLSAEQQLSTLQQQLQGLYQELAKAHTAPVTCERHAVQSIVGLRGAKEVAESQVQHLTAENEKLRRQLAEMDCAYEQALSRIEAQNG